MITNHCILVALIAAAALISCFLALHAILPHLTAAWRRATAPGRTAAAIAALVLALYAGVKPPTNAPPAQLSAPRPRQLAAFPDYRRIPADFLVPEDFYFIHTYATNFTPVLSGMSVALWALRGACEDWWPAGDYVARSGGSVVGVTGEFPDETIGFDAGLFYIAGVSSFSFAGREFSWSDLYDSRTNAVSVRLEIDPLEITVQTNDLAYVFRKLYNPKRDPHCIVRLFAQPDPFVVSGCVSRTICADWHSLEIIRGSATLSGDGGGKISLWSDSACSTPLSLPLTVDAYERQNIVCYATYSAPSESAGDIPLALTLEGEAYGPDGRPFSVERNLRLSSVLFSGLDATSDAAGVSRNPPPFPLGFNDFTFAYTPTPERHLLIPFKNVADPETLAANDYFVRLRPLIEPEDAEPAIVTLGDGLGPTEGGIYGLGAFYDGLFSTGALVLPHSGAEISQIVLRDLERTSNFVARAMSELSERYCCRHLMASLWFGTTKFARYRGRPNALASPTVRIYNQLDNTSGLGAYATLFGYPVGLAKVTSVVCGYACELMGFEDNEHQLVQDVGTANTPAAAFAWDAGRQIAQGTNAVEAVTRAARTCWLEGDAKGDVLWPNPNVPDNYLDTDYTNDPNEHFYSPGFLFADPLEFSDWYDVIENEIFPLAGLLYSLLSLD